MSVVDNLTTYTFETVSVDNNGEISDRQPSSARCFSESLGAEISLDLVAIPGGTFIMGDNRHHQDERPLHQVTLPAFFIGKSPITVAQYRQIMGEDKGYGLGLDDPIEKISWHDALEFCTKLSHQTGRKYTLPSESQWEYACRAGTDTAFHFGDIITPDLVNYNGDYPYAGAPTGANRERATPVGSFPPNAFGLSDMHGNVWEWCMDTYQPSYQGAPTDGSAWIDANATERDKRVMRGGAWDYVARGCRSAVRCSLAPDLRMNGCGLRVALEEMGGGSSEMGEGR
ncbi:formylglycine-generating enzyme family protein [Chamaesiphon sp. VAR_48_metabat_403]|uniref:formylglycine-generating enzyme family protein n=1 Tax=Chamaesiphon sp. VAR_48_metabat_403 TaxID=2964700 RepID=UPI00286DA97C|nr:formylglycine-generating enzyme family protein [Chamaesiphon sp. VAR_48_metabat_403]